MKKITYAIVKALETAIRAGGYPLYVNLVKGLSVLSPTANIPAINSIKSLLCKVNGRVTKRYDMNIVIHSLYVTSCPSDTFIGTACSEVGIDKSIVEGVTSIPAHVNLTLMMVVELEAYRAKCGLRYVDMRDWLVRITGAGSDILPQTLRTSWLNARKKRLLLTRNKDKAGLDLMWTSLYHLPKKSVPDTSVLKEKIVQLATQNRDLKRELKCYEKSLVCAYNDFRRIENELADNIISSEKLESDLDKKEDELRKAAVHYRPSNVDRRDAAHNIKIKELQTKIKESLNEVNILHLLLDSMQCELDGHNLTITRLMRSRKRFKDRCNKLKATATIVESTSKIKKIMSEKIQLQIQLDDLLLKTEDNSKSILNLFSGGGNDRYSDEVRALYMELSQLVSSKNISKVVAAVLNILIKLDITETDLPKETFCKLIRQEASIVSSRQVAGELLATSSATQHSDGTSRNGQKVVDL